MGAQGVNISVGLPPSAVAKIAALYFEIFQRKLGLVLGRRDGVAMIADHLNADRVIVACESAQVVGIAGLRVTTRPEELDEALGLGVAGDLCPLLFLLLGEQETLGAFVPVGVFGAQLGFGGRRENTRENETDQ